MWCGAIHYPRQSRKRVHEDEGNVEVHVEIERCSGHVTPRTQAFRVPTCLLLFRKALHVFFPIPALVYLLTAGGLLSFSLVMTGNSNTRARHRTPY